jgi:dienelactone hydrolase
MRAVTIRAAALCAAIGLAAAGEARAQETTREAEGARTVRFRGRTIDLRPFFEGFPYLGFRAELQAERLLYFHDTPGGRRLLQLPLRAGETPLDLPSGLPLGDVDWNRRGLRDLRYVPSRSEYVVLADDRNEERYNVFAMASDTGSMRRLTDHDYVYGMGLDKPRARLAYIARHGQRGPYRSCLRVIDLTSGADREVVCDTPELTFTWCSPSFRPDGSAVILQALRASDRTHENLVLVSLAEERPALRVLTELETRRRNVEVLDDWLDGERFVYTSDEDGFTNVYRFDLQAHAAGQPARVQLTRFTEDVDSLVAFEAPAETERAPDGGSPANRAVNPDASTAAAAAPTAAPSPSRRTLVGAVVKRPYESEVFALDPTTGQLLQRRVFDASMSPLDHRGDVAFFASQSRRRMFSLEQLSLVPTPGAAGGPFALAPRTRARVPDTVARAVETCEVERVRIPTFDRDPRTGRDRVLHAFLHTPKVPPSPGSARFALVQSFYGGENRWDTQAQILCAAGAIVLSPSVRGSAGFGADFAALNDRDLGGNEMFDLVFAARWLAAREGLRERNIGVYGGSHGGYAAMRALSMPAEVNGRSDRFEWGFGLSWFGFSNIVTFHERCNIPDWVLLEAGDPRTERAKLLDRSPISHVDRVRAPLLLLHGENDNRVPVTESRQMADALRRARKRYVYEEFAGQGHGLKGLENQHRVWTVVLRFLERDAGLGAPARRAPGSDRRARHARIAVVCALALLAALAAGARAAEAPARTTV